MPDEMPETRYIAFGDVEMRHDDNALRFSGHAAVFGKRTYIGAKPYGFWESVNTGAFAKAISEGDVRMLHNHDPNLILARSTIGAGPGSLSLKEEQRGLHTKAEWVQTQYAADLAVNVRAGTINQMSFSFAPVKEEWGKDPKSGEDTRALIEVRLFDVSTVTFPAYDQTDAAMRAVGINGLLRYADLDDESRTRLYAAIRTGLITPDLAPSLRAASQALAELAQRYEPAEATRAEGVERSTVNETEQRKLRYRALAVMGGDMTKGIKTS